MHTSGGICELSHIVGLFTNLTTEIVQLAVLKRRPLSTF